MAVEELLATMERYDIGRALVRIEPADFETDAPFSNGKLYEACSRQPELSPCPVVVPNTAGDLPDESEQVAEAVARGAGAVWIRPKADYWIIAEWLSDRLFGALSDCRMPVYVSAEMLSLPDVADLAGRFGKMPIILAEVGYRLQRVLLPMLERFDNIHLCTGRNYRNYRGIEQIVERVGADRLLFGSGFPDSEPMAAIVQLMYADITDEQKRRIGSENIERLTGGIQR